MKTFLVLLVALSGSLTVIAAEQAWVGGPRTETIPLTVADGGKVYLDALVNGRKVRLAVDTGAGTTLDLDLAENLGIRTEPFSDGAYSLGGDAMKMRRGSIRFQLGEMTVGGLPVFFLDMKLARKQFAEMKMTDVDGVVGAEVLLQFQAVIDYQKKRLTIHRPKKS